MGFPDDIGIIETFVGMPSRNRKEVYKFLAPHLRDESQDYKMPAQYMFKDVPPDLDESVDPRGRADGQPRPPRHRDGPCSGSTPTSRTASGPSPSTRRASSPASRSTPTTRWPPSAGCSDIDERYGLAAISTFPAGFKVPINDKKMYPLYAHVRGDRHPHLRVRGIPGPRIPFAPQHVELIDEVMYDFPELTFVMRHGAEPWTELAVKLMLKWPNLHYSTSAFAPSYYPKAVIDFANTRGADKVMYAGYFPAGLSYDRIFSELPDVPLADEVWPKFLRENARRVLKLG